MYNHGTLILRLIDMQLLLLLVRSVIACGKNGTAGRVG